MTPEESLELLLEAHREPVDEAHFAAVRARVMEKIAARRRGPRKVWWAFAGVASAVVVAALWVEGPAPSRVARRVAPIAANAVKRPAASASVSVGHQVSSSPRHAGRKPGIRPEGLTTHWAIVGPRISQPMVVKMVTDDPDVVIYWITEGTGE